MECKFCNLPLEGRANKLYHYKCKIKHNNALRKAKNEFHSKFLEPIDHNYSILESLCRGEGVTVINTNLLQEMLFDYNAVTIFHIGDHSVMCLVYEYLYMQPGSDAESIIVYNTATDLQ